MLSKRDPLKGFTLTIFCWIVSAAILFSLIGVVAREDPVVQQQSLEYTQNFFYGIIAAGLYILIAILLAIYTASARSVRLSRKDRRTVEGTSIILRTITFAVFLLGGAAVYSAIEGWSFMDALYWADTTLLTIGIGNLAPKTHLGRSLLFPYAASGIISLGLVISSIASFTKNMKNMKLRFKLKEARIDLHERADLDGPADSTHNENEKRLAHAPPISQFPSKHELSKIHRIKSAFNRRRRWEALAISLVAWFLLWLVSAAIFRRSERSQGWTYFEALYFTYTSLTTIGYGDFYPTSNFGNVFFVFWSLLAVPVLTSLATVMGELGLRTLTYFATYLWKAATSKTCPWQYHRRGKISKSHGERSSIGLTSNVSGPESLNGTDDIERHAQGPSTIGQSAKDLQRVGTESNSAGNEIDEPAQNKLLLAEEIDKLIAALRNESVLEDPFFEWTRILSLLHAGQVEDESSSLEPTAAASHHGAQLARKVMGSETATAERNSEILLMLKFLVEKLCYDLRKELYRETE